jgi:hypothetical protein
MGKHIFKSKENIPSYLVDDFDTFIDYLIKHDVVLTLKSQNFKQKDLYAMNELMIVPEQDVTPKNNQVFYPLLNLFYHLVLRGKLFYFAGSPGQLKLVPDERLSIFQQLTDYEKYFFLLETLWIDADWPTLQTNKYNRISLYYVYQVTELLSELKPDEVFQVKGSTYRYLFDYWFVFLKYFFFFGFWDFVEGEALTKLEYRADKIIPTEFGVAMAGILYQERKLTFWNQPYQQSYESKIAFDIMNGKVKLSGLNVKKNKKAREILNNKKKAEIEKEKSRLSEPFFKAFTGLFPAGVLKKTLPRLEETFIEGIYILKVSLGRGIWRRIKIAAQHTLLDLHNIIQDVFGFYDDHLYAFYMSNKAWSGDCYNSPQCDTGPYVHEAKIGDLDLYVGKRILYLFDFGDEWHFKILVEEIKENEDKLSKPVLIGEKGESPEQYDYY